MNWFALLPQALKPRSNRGRILLWSCLITLIFGIFEFGTTLEDSLRDLRNGTSRRVVSGDITLVAIDDRSLDELGSFPWPRQRHATLAQRLDDLGADRIFFDIVFADKSTPENDRVLAKTIHALGPKVVLPLLFSFSPAGERIDSYPLLEFRARSDLAHINFRYDEFGRVRRLPFDLMFGDRRYPSFASKLARVRGDSEDFPIDFSLRPSSVPTVSAADVISGSVDPNMIKGKDVIIGATFQPLNDGYVAPSWGTIPGVYLHILGAETLKSGKPLEISWLLSLVPSFLIVCGCILLRNRILSVVGICVGVCGYLVLPTFLEHRLIFIEIVPPLFLLLIVGVALSWASLRQMYRLRGTTNQISGLPNLAALHQRKVDHDRALIAARIHNYAAIASTLPPEAEKALVEQIAKRLMVGAVEPILYQGDEGIFAWFAEGAAPTSTGAHLHALHTLFRSPLTVDGRHFDLKITFGFDVETERSVANRFASALVAADEAAEEGRKWKQYDPATLESAAWKLSLLSQLDNAIDAGDLWVAYQPKLDLKSNRIVGAEALARWTHPDKGPISPMEFILAAEENDRIEKLTEFVLERAIRAAAAVNQHGIDFNVSVNLSGRLIDDPDLTTTTLNLLRRYGLAPSQLTLEVTETAALSSTAPHLEALQRLRDAGVRISVDDYGTGMSTLDYLQRIPATEIKIDRSFVQGMQESHGTKVMVNSTIQLAHSLGQEVVAEGVEDDETLEELRRMNCDLAQGYLIGRPMTFRALSKRVLGERRQDVA